MFSIFNALILPRTEEAFPVARSNGQEDDSLAELRQETAVLPPMSQQSLEGQSGKLLSVSRN